ncbi:organic cation transporter protein-like isoform X2 [Pectinophora gossypiella]|uniref:organic cation transporter protein-like isoform X2 n=1 Tax=Pectinophora gossypiella TaxID=13191 RepID=UPI00214EF835|nr:organic cation transporter protein-like isoform X2 [Pectinophora gossypiella]
MEKKPAAYQESRVEASGVDTDRLMQELGQFRRFHLINYCLLALVGYVAAHYAINYVFLAGDVHYRCVIPECEAPNSTEFYPKWLPSRAVDVDLRTRRCMRARPADEGACHAEGFGEHLELCDQWLYASKDTIVAEFNLACQEWKRTLVGTIHNIGMLVSLPILGYISDRWGRKRALILSCTLVGAIGTLKAFSVSYEMYVIIEFLETIAGASAFPAAYILTIELLGQDKRVLTTAFLGIVLVIGGLSFALLAKTFSYWRTFILIAYPPSLLFLSYIYLLPESIRWLLSKGRKEEAVEIIMRAAKMNKVTLSEETMRQLTEEKVKPIDEKTESKENEGLWMQVVRSPIIMTRLAICSWWWITCTFVFYGLAINSVSLAGDKYTNYMLVVSVEVIAVVTNALVLDKFGRKRTLLVAYTVCGIACVAITFVPSTMAWLATLLYLLGKIAITQAFSGIYMYTSELFPTHARHSLLGFCSMVGRIGSIVAPQMPLLAIYVSWLPSVLFGATALVAGALMLTTPETLNTRLPDTIAEAEQLARPRRMFESNQMTSRC